MTAIGLRKVAYGTQSLRRTSAAMIYRATGNIRAIQVLLGDTTIENTVRYPGVDVEGAFCWPSELKFDFSGGRLIISLGRFEASAEVH